MMDKGLKTYATVCFYLILGALAAAIISDIVILGEQILAFITALVSSAFVFMLGLILFVVSIMLLFGIFLIEQYGFWPVTWAANNFRDVMAESPVTDNQLNIMIVIRIALLGICFFVFISSIVLKSKMKKERLVDKTINQRPARAFSGVSLGLSLLGLFVGTGVIVILFLALS